MRDMGLVAGRAWRCAAASSVIWCASGRADAQWELIDPPNAGPIIAFGVADGDPDVVYVATNPDGAWETLDGGATDLRWLFSGMGLYEVHMTAAPIAPGNNQYRYTMSIGGGIRRTSNGGQSWSGGTPPGGQPHIDRPWSSLAVNPLDGVVLLAGGDGVIKRTTNAGSSWNSTEGVPGDVIVTDIEWVQGTGDDSVVWAATSSCGGWGDDRECADLYDKRVGSHGVLSSTDGGRTWVAHPVDPVGTSPRNFVNAIATIPNKPFWVIAATDDGLWITVDAGATWSEFTPAGLTARRISAVSYAAAPAPTIYIGTEEGVWRGEVGQGIAWSPLTAFPLDFVTAMGSTFETSNLLYVGYADGSCWSTRSAGASASPIRGAHGAYPLSTVAIRSDDERTVYAGTVCEQGIFRGTIASPASVSWEVMEKNFGQSHGHFHYVMRVVQHPLIGDVTFATDNNSLWRTIDAGANWYNMGNFGFHAHGLAVARTNPSRLYLGNGHGNWGTHTHTLRVGRSDDLGATWADVTNDFPQPGTETSLIDITVSPLDEDVVYVATFGAENYPLYEGGREDGEGQGVMRTLDAGQTWGRVVDGLALSDDNLSWWVASVDMSASGGTLITYIATLDGLYRMVGASGARWEDISPADGWRRFESITVDPADPRILYAGTSETETSGPGRIYESTDGGASWSPMTIEMAPRAWADQYRVRDIQIGDTRAYAVVEGSGIYLLDRGDPCPADVNADDVVDFDDLLAVVDAWGECPGCREDVNGDAVVDFRDLLALLAAWGPCP